MAHDNPYAAPDDDLSPIYDVVDSEGRVWRSGKLLVFTRDASLPQRCIKCNASQDVSMRRQKLYYYPQWILLFIFCNLIVLILLAMVFRKTALTHLGVCGHCGRRRRKAIITSCFLLLVSVGLFISLAILPDAWSPQAPAKVGIPIVILAVTCLLAAAILGMVRGQFVVVRKIDNVQVRLGWIHREYLALLPDGP